MAHKEGVPEKELEISEPNPTSTKMDSPPYAGSLWNRAAAGQPGLQPALPFNWLLQLGHLSACLRQSLRRGTFQKLRKRSVALIRMSRRCHRSLASCLPIFPLPRQGAKAPAMALPMVTGMRFFTRMSPQLSGAPEPAVSRSGRSAEEMRKLAAMTRVPPNV